MQNGREMEWKILEKNMARKVEWNRGGKGMEKERKKKFKFTGVNISWNGIEMEWNFHNKKSQCKIEWKWNGIGMENFREKKSVGYVVEMEWQWNEFFFDKTSRSEC